MTIKEILRTLLEDTPEEQNRLNPGENAETNPNNSDSSEPEVPRD